MKPWERILHYLTLGFVVFSLIGALFVPSHVQFIFDDLFFPFGLIYLAITFFKSPKWRLFILVFAAMALWGVLSDTVANGTIRTSSFGMLLRWLKWPILCVAVAEFGKLNIKRDYVENGVILAFLALAGMNIFMIINPFGMGKDLSEMYSPKIEMLLSNYHEFGAFRLSGTMLNPNTNGILFGLFLVFFLHKNDRKYWTYIILTFALIFLTQSRTVMLMTLVVFGLFILNANSRKVNMILIPAGLVTLIAGLFMFRSTNLMSIFNGSAFQSNSWTQRLEHYEILFGSGGKDLLLGHGLVLDPLNTVGFYFDSEYLSIGYQYGLIGIIIWIIIILVILSIVRKINRKTTFGWSLVAMILGVAATNFSFLNVESATLMMILVGAWLFGQSSNELYNYSEEKSEKNPI